MLDRYARNILNLLYENGELTRKQLMDKLKMRLNSLVDSCNYLESERYILRTGSNQVRNVPLMLNPSRFAVLGVEHTLETLICIMVDPAGRVIAQKEYPLNSTGEARLREICSSLREIVNSAGEYELCAIGFADLGIVNAATGEVVYASGLAGWENIAISRVLEEEMHCMVKLIDRSGAAALEELRRAPGSKFVRTSLQIFVGEGIGASILQNGRYWGADVPSSCQLGHTIALPGGAKCRCGNCGCLETVSALPAIVKNANCNSFAKFREAVASGNAAALAALHTGAEYLGTAIANVVTFTAITSVVIHSELADMPEFMETVQATVLERTIYPFVKEVKFTISSTGRTAGASGAAFYAQKEFFSADAESKK